MEARSRGVETAAPRDRLGGVGADRPARSDPGARRRNAPAAARLPDAAAPGALDARRDAGREAALVRRGIPSALRRRRAGEHGRALPASPRRAGPRAPRARRLRDPPRALRSVPEGLHDPERQGGRRLPGGDRGMPRPDHPPHPAPAGRELHGRGRHRQVVERLQLVPGYLQEPDPGQHRPADHDRPRDRPRVPRGIPGPPRVQHAAREEPGA